MFGFLKNLFAKNRVNHLVNYVDGLVQVAQIVTSTAVKNHLEKSIKLDEDAVWQRAAAWGNYLFGKKPSDQHSHLDLEAEHRKAAAWLENEGSGFQELVVQGLRISNMTAFARKGTTPEIGMTLLERFGKNFPDRPEPDEYGALLQLAILGNLQSDQRDSIFRFIKNGPYAPYFKTSKTFGWG